MTYTLGAWTFSHGLPGLLVGGLLLLCVGAAVFLYVRESRLQPAGRILFGVLRFGVLALLLLLFLQPSRSFVERVSTKKKLLVLVDTSRSMGIRDNRKTDEELAEAALAVGKLSYGDVRLRQVLTRAEHSMEISERALRRGKREEAVEALDRAEDALQLGLDALSEAAAKDTAPRAGKRAEAEGQAPSRARPALTGVVERRLRGLAGRQRALREALRLHARGQAAGRKALSDLAEKQEKLRAELGVVLAASARAPLASRAALTEKARRELAGLSRIDLVKGILGGAGREESPPDRIPARAADVPGPSFLDRMSGSCDIHYCGFARDLKPLGRHGPLSREAVAGLEADGEATYLGTMVEQAVNRYGDGPLAGVVLLTDGASNGGASIHEVARSMGERGVPIFPVGVGVPQPDDVWLQSIVLQEVAFPGDTVPISVQIRSRGYENRQAYLSVSVDGRRVSRKSVLLKGFPQFVPISFDVKGSAKRNLRVEVSVSSFPDETTDRNNREERLVRVVDEKINLLCIEGSARWEYRYLRAILKRDPRIRAKFIMAGAKPQLARLAKEYVSRFPEGPEEAFSYDLVILGDVRSSFFTDEQMLRIEQLVRDQGGSLLMVAGQRYAPVSYAGTPIEKLLPVRFDRGGKWKEAARDVHPVLTREGRCSMVMMLADSKDRQTHGGDSRRTWDRNDAIWARMKPLGRIPPLIAARPAATVLARLSDPGTQLSRYPLISWQRYGAGKSMFIATDRMWRLRFKTGDKYHWRLWSQAIQFLTLSRLLTQHRRIGLATDRPVYREGEQARIMASVLNEAYEPLIAPFYEVHVRRTSESSSPAAAAGKDESAIVVRLKPVPRRPGVYEGYFSPGKQGQYRLLARPVDRPHAHDAEFHVSVVERELATTGLQERVLRTMAKASGGRYLSIRELPVLPELIEADRPSVTVVKEMTVWDTWPMALAFVLFAGMEWFLRRRHDLA